MSCARIQMVHIEIDYAIAFSNRMYVGNPSAKSILSLQ